MSYFPSAIIKCTGADGLLGTADDKLELAPKGQIVVLKPYDRLVVACKLPAFDPDMFSFDCVCLMKSVEPCTHALSHSHSLSLTLTFILGDKHNS